jgi:ABC-type transporter Mla subunit MlaD
VASIEEIIGSVQSVIDKLDDAATATQGAVSNCDDAISQAMGLSATSLVGALQAVKATIESGASQVAVAGETFKEAIAQAQAAQDGT